MSGTLAMHLVRSKDGSDSLWHWEGPLNLYYIIGEPRRMGSPLSPPSPLILAGEADPGFTGCSWTSRS